MKRLRYSTDTPQTPESYTQFSPPAKLSTSQSYLHSPPGRLSAGEDLFSSEMSYTLTKSHYFVKYKSDGVRSVCKVYFSENLMQLVIEKDSSYSVLVPTSDIVSIELGFSKQTLSALLRGDHNNRIYGFRILSAKKTLEMSCNSRIEREKWAAALKKLLEVHADWRSSYGLRNYWDTLIAASTSQTYIDNMSSQFRIESEQRLHSENSQLQQKHLEETRAKEEEIAQLKEDLMAAEGQLGVLYKSIEYSSLEELPKIWMKILEYFSIKELLTLKCVSRFYKELVQKYLCVKNNWRRLPIGSLVPRRVSWKLFFDKFYMSVVKDTKGQVPAQMLAEIQRDVSRGLPDSQNEVVWLLASLCSHNPEIGYCQGMQQVAHFLLKKIRNTDKALKIVLALVRPPYFLGDMWKTGMPRLKIAVFQLEFLVQLKLPILAKHLVLLDLKLDVIVSSWLITLFVNLHAQQGFPLKEIEHIWDFFFVLGWPALISTCLALLDLSQQYVIGESLEKTLEVYTNQLHFQDLFKSIARFEVDGSLLDDLERAYYLQ